MRLNTLKWLVVPGLLIAACFVIASCDEPTPMTKSEEVTQFLTGTGATSKSWHLQSVTVDGVDKSSLFDGMTLSFTATNFTVSNGGPVWPGNGTWSFTSDAATTIERNDGLEIVVDATATSLKLTLLWEKTTFEPGRKKSVEGQHVFTFN